MFPLPASVASTGPGRLPVVGRSLDVGRSLADPLLGAGLWLDAGPPLEAGLLKDVSLAEPLEYSERVGSSKATL